MPQKERSYISEMAYFAFAEVAEDAFYRRSSCNS